MGRMSVERSREIRLWVATGINLVSVAMVLLSNEETSRKLTQAADDIRKFVKGLGVRNGRD